MLVVSHNTSAEEATGMDDRTTMLFGLDESTVVDDGAVRVMIETQAGEGACPPGGQSRPDPASGSSPGAGRKRVFAVSYLSG